MNDDAETDGVLAELRSEVPADFVRRFDEIVALTDAFCDAHLGDEYKALCREMASGFCRHGAPAATGKAASWAAGIVYALGQVNFLSDPGQVPNMTSARVARGFGISVSTMRVKGADLRIGFDLYPFNPSWCLPSLVDGNPMVWMLEFNGAIVDVRKLPRAAQAVAFEQGLIPYIPADKK